MCSMHVTLIICDTCGELKRTLESHKSTNPVENPFPQLVYNNTLRSALQSCALSVRVCGARESQELLHLQTATFVAAS